MWKCKKCGTNNKSKYTFCQACGNQRPVYQGQPIKTANNTILIALIGLLTCICIVLIALLIKNANLCNSIYTSNEANNNTKNSYEVTPQIMPPQYQSDAPSYVKPQMPVYTPEPTPRSTPTMATVPTPVATQYINSTYTPYGYAFWNYKQNGIAYRDGEILQLISDTYYGRADDQGKYKEGYSSSRNRDNEYGYDFGFYYGDNLLYYAEVRTGSPAEILVKLYYWDGVLIGCRDYRGNDSNLYMRGSDNCDRIAREFSYVYSLGAR